jgi:hypothetical protein
MNNSEVEDGDYMCIPKLCKDRTPLENETCSMKEDFVTIEEGDDVVKCYYYRGIYEESGKCILEEECPMFYPPVCFYIFILLYGYVIFLSVNLYMQI